MFSQICGSWEQTFQGQLDVNFDYFIFEEYQMFESLLQGIGATDTDSVVDLCVVFRKVAKKLPINVSALSISLLSALLFAVVFKVSRCAARTKLASRFDWTVCCWLQKVKGNKSYVVLLFIRYSSHWASGANSSFLEAKVTVHRGLVASFWPQTTPDNVFLFGLPCMFLESGMDLNRKGFTPI